MTVYFADTTAYKPASTTNIASPTIKKIVAPVPLGIGLIRGIFSLKKGGSFVAHFNPYTLLPGSSIFLIVGIDEIVALPGL